MKTVPLKSFLRAAFFSLVIISCTVQPDPTPQDEYDEANQQITNGNFNSAISTMTERLNHDPRDKRARLILASAYAARAGIFMKDFIAIGKIVSEKQKQSDESWKNNQGRVYDEMLKLMSDDQLKDAAETLARVDKTVYQVKEMVATFEMIPSIKSENIYDVQKAVNVLDVEPNYRDGPSLYRGLLRLLLLRAQLDKNYGLTEFQKCKINFELAAAGFLRLQIEVKKLLQDFILGLQPDKVGKLPQVAKDFDSQMATIGELLQKIPSGQLVDVKSLDRGLGRQCRP